MNGPRKIYVAECGEYSDYHVICAFESEEDARQAHVGDDIKEMILYPTGVQPVATHLGWRMTARVFPTGEAQPYLPPERSVHHDWEVDEPATPMSERPKVEAQDLTFTSMWNCWLVTASGYDFEATKKALDDRVAHIRAEVMGL